MRSEEGLAEYLPHELASWPRPFSMIVRCGCEINPPLSHRYMTWHTAAASHHLQQCPRLTGVNFYIVLFGSIQQRMDRSVNNTNSTRRSGMGVRVSCLMDMTLSAQRTQSTLVAYNRPEKCSYIEVNIRVSMSQQELLGNTANKVEAAGCEVHRASVDADRLIVLTELDVADTCDARVLVGEDTDLLVQLIVLSDPEKYIKMLMSEREGHPDKVYSSVALRSAL